MDKKMFSDEVGFKIKVIRMRNKLSQEKLSELADCSLSLIGFIERGETSVSLYHFVNIARALSININEFLSEIEK